MGQAKLKSTFEQRKQEAELRLAKERLAKSAIDAIRPKGKSQLGMLIAASIALGAGGLNDHN